MKIFFVLFMLLYASCSSFKGSESSRNCNENKKIKTLFFDNILFIENYVLYQEKHKESLDLNITDVSYKDNNQNFKNFKKKIKFLGKYVEISNNVYSYSFSYPSLLEFKKDKEKWVEWYDDNKCFDLH